VAAANVAFCAGDSGVSISGSATGGTGPGTYNFEWVPATGLTDAFSAATTAGPTVTTAYSLFATDANGCTSLPAVVTVTVNPLPIPNAGPDQFTCNQNPVVLQGSATAGSGNYAFSWLPTAHLSNPASATPAATPDTSIVYTLSVTDLTTGCANTLADPLSQVTVFVVAPTQAEAGPAQVTVCAGDSVWIGHPTLGTVPGLTYTWSPATGLANPASGYTRAAPAATTTYTLSVSEGACLGLPDAITVNVLPAPVVSLQDPQGPFCVRTSFTPNYSVVGGVAPLAYQWLVQGSLATAYTGPAPTFVADSSFVLGLRVVDAQGCAGEAFAYVDVTPEPPLSAGPDVSYCATALTQGITLNADFAGTSATWLAPINLSIPNPLVNPSETQQYVLRGVYANNCQVFDTVTVFVLPGIVPSISASDTDVCSGTPIWLSASGGVGAATFQWSPTAGLESPTSANTVANPKGVGLADTLVYTVTVAEGGCSADTSIRVVVRPTPLVDFLPSTLSACLPATQVGFLNATQNAIEYAWNFGDGTTDTTAQPLHTYTQPGSYAVTLTAWSDPSRHCFAQATFPVPVVIHDSLLARIATTLLGPTDTLWLPNGATQFADASTGSTASFWDFGDGQSATGANVTHRYQTPGDYTVTLIAENAGGCRDTVTYTPVVVRQEVLLPIPNVFTPNGDGYNDVFRVLYTGTQPFRLTITDRWGVHVFDADTPSQGWEASNAPAGVYYYRLKIGDRVILGSVTLLR
jgi:gliding motility-associated-like protein